MRTQSVRASPFTDMAKASTSRDASSLSASSTPKATFVVSSLEREICKTDPKNAKYKERRLAFHILRREVLDIKQYGDHSRGPE